MKTLVLLRHAKSEAQSFTKSDFKRHLNERGRNDIIKIAHKFLNFNIQPEVILCSPASRTRETLERFLNVTEWTCPVIYVDELYHAVASDILSILKRYEGAYNSLMIVGHNFGISNLANLLSSNGAEEMPTSGLYCFNFSSEIELYEGQLLHYLKPKEI